MRTSHRRQHRRRSPLVRTIGVIAGIGLIAAACGSDDDEAEPAASEAPAATDAPVDTETPVESDAPVRTERPVDTEAPVEAAGTPERVVSLSPTHTEIMFAIGAGDLLVAVDQFSNHPAEALELPNELSGFEPNVEAIASFEPDLVLIGGDFTGLGDQLAELDIDSWDGPAAASLADSYRQIEELGAVTGRIDEAADVVASMRSEIDAIVAETPTRDEPLSFYHELDPTLFSADSSTFIGEIYALIGLQNIADGDETDSFGFPQLNAEFIIDANPDLVFLADTKCCDETPETVAARPGWDAITAVQNGDVVPMDDDIASRWGPRTVDYLRAVAAAVANV